jgi:deoxyadenosine/deoxycytidine kinase
VLEPVAEWTRPLPPHHPAGVLGAFYADPPRYRFAFRMYALLTRTRAVQAALASGARLVLTERCNESEAEAFGPAGAGQTGPEEAALHDAVYGACVDGWAPGHAPSAHVFLVCDPEVSLRRCRSRGRAAEAAASLAYLRRLHDAHLAWADRLRAAGARRVLVLDAGADGEAGLRENAARVVEWLAVGGNLPSGSHRGSDGGL